MNLAIIAGSLPTVKPLLKWALTNLKVIKPNNMTRSRRWHRATTMKPLGEPETTEATVDSLQAEPATPVFNMEDKLNGLPKYSANDYRGSTMSDLKYYVKGDEITKPISKKGFASTVTSKSDEANT